MNTRTNAAQKHEEKVANAGAPPHGEQVPPLDEVANVEQAPANPPSMTEAEMRDILAQMAQSMTTQAQDTTVQAQSMTVQANQEISPRPHQQVTTMASHLRDFTQMNAPTLYGFKVDEDPQEFIDEVYKILYAMGVSSIVKVELATYQLKDLYQTWYVQWRDNRPLRGGLVTWEIMKKAFLHCLFPRDMKEAKVVEFINL